MKSNIITRLSVAVFLVAMLTLSLTGVGLAATSATDFGVQIATTTSVLAPMADPVVDGLLDSSYTWLEHFTKGPSSGNTTLAPGDLYGYEGTDTCYWA
ncbi:MAG: hypothetical protein D6775_01585, partial [Caldilineae bacterium]